MARIDSILSIVLQQGADELRIGTDKAPRMLAGGVAKRLALPATPDDMLRHLLGPLLTPEREEQLRAFARVELTYVAESLGTFAVTLTRRTGEATMAIDAVFLKGARKGAPRDTGSLAAVVSPALAPAVDGARGASPSAPPIALDEAPLTHTTHAQTTHAPLTSTSPDAPHPSDALVALLAQADSLHASDLHLLSGEPPTARVDGVLIPLDGTPADAEALLAGCLTRAAHARLAAGASADLAFEVDGVGRFRMNVYRASTGLAAAIRLFPRTAPTLAELRLPWPIHDLVDLPHGLVIVSGPTGSGKSTTLASLASEVLRKRSCIVLTLEDPIELTLDPRGQRGLVRQRQVGRDVRDFPTGLRDALREDPDVLVIGEMRDAESISLALTAAETGHLVLTSLHSRSCASAVDRIIDSYAPERHHQIRTQLADSLRAVISQRLVPRAAVAFGGGSRSGRVVALEVLRATHNVASLVREGKTAQLASAIQSARREGMVTLERCLADLCKSGEITADDARANANDLAALALYMQ